MAAPVRLFPSSWRILLEKPFYLAHIPKCRRCRSAVSAAVKPRTWQLHSAVCLQRFPVITQELTPLEEKYLGLLQEREVRGSLLSDYELQEIDEKKKMVAEKASDVLQKKYEEKPTSTLEDIDRQWTEELMAFKVADRTTEADRVNDTRSPERKLDRKLILVVKFAFDNETEGCWRLPQVERQDGESMRQAAERALLTKCGAVNATFVGNAPCGYQSYKLPPNFTEAYGVKKFFFKASYNKGEITLGDKVTDYKWVTKEELKEYLHPEALHAMKDFLVEY